MKKYSVHGGDLDLIERIYEIPRNEIIDFSGNVNPLGISQNLKKILIDNIDLISTYPDIKYTKLRESIGEYTNSKQDNILVGNGSTELISLFIKNISPKKTLIVSPAYSEYEKTARLMGSEILLFPLDKKDDFKTNILDLIEELKDNVDLLVICNPNNPTGSYITTNEMDLILSYAKKNNVYVMVDETYIEFSDGTVELSSIPLTDKYDNLFVVRGTSKFFAVPGLRLGYCICSNNKIKDSISSLKDPWSVNILAEKAGIFMFRDKEYIEKTKKLITEERDKFFKNLSKIKCIKLYPTQSNFILIKVDNSIITSDKIFDECIKDKMVIRDASDFPYLGNEYVRFCFLSPENNDKLIRKLKYIFNPTE